MKEGRGIGEMSADSGMLDILSAGFGVPWQHDVD